MSQIDWSKAPEWARVVGKAGVSGFLVWIDHKKYSYMNGDFGGREFIIGDPCMWRNDEIEVVDTRPTAKWNGTGLPPVGVPCEAELYSGGGWIEGFVSYYGKANFVFESSQLTVGVEIVGKIRTSAFRPIRTPEQIAAEEREAAVQAMLDGYSYPNSDIARAVCGYIYDAGYRKQSTKQDGE